VDHPSRFSLVELMIQKIRKKSSAYQHHGKHKSVLMEVRAQEPKPKPKSKMYSSVRDALRSRD
jgi:hypothetical protein